MTDRAAITIREADDSDTAALWGMLEPVFRAGDTYAIDPGIERAEALCYWMSERAYLAHDAGAPVGTYYIRKNQKGGGAHVCNCGFVTASAAQGKGVAREMLADALVRARGLGFEAMQFNFVLANNTRAIEVWTRAGFKVIGRQPRAFIHPRDGYVDALMMWKDLT